MRKVFCFLALASSCFSFDLAIDVGHNAIQSGALSASCKKEYEYNKDLTSYIMKKMAVLDPKIQIKSNVRNTKVTFEDRYDMSKAKNLFISIHHDSVMPQFITYNQHKCPQSNHAKGYSIFVSRKNIDFQKSLYFAKKFANSLKSAGLKPSLHHNENIGGENRELIDKDLGIYVFDDLKVLKNSFSPAFLFEAGVIVNSDDEKTIGSNHFREIVSDAVYSIVGQKGESPF